MFLYVSAIEGLDPADKQNKLSRKGLYDILNEVSSFDPCLVLADI